jgi:hypothetical protein
MRKKKGDFVRLRVHEHIVFLISIVLFLGSGAQTPQPSSATLPHSKTLEILLNDLDHYKTTNPVHAGHLLAHLMWTEQWISLWAEQNSGPCRGLSEREKTVLAFAGLIHDVGKAGVARNLVYYRIPDHERIGFEFVMHGIVIDCAYTNVYRTIDGKPFCFDDVFQELGFSFDEQKRIALLIAMHSAFIGMLMKGIESDIYIEQFLKMLFDVAIEIDFELSESLIHMVMVISLADVHAVYFPVAQGASRVFGTFKQYPTSELWGHCDWKLKDAVFAYLDAEKFDALKKRICAFARAKSYIK